MRLFFAEASRRAPFRRGPDRQSVRSVHGTFVSYFYHGNAILGCGENAADPIRDDTRPDLTDVFFEFNGNPFQDAFQEKDGVGLGLGKACRIFSSSLGGPAGLNLSSRRSAM